MKILNLLDHLATAAMQMTATFGVAPKSITVEVPSIGYHRALEQVQAYYSATAAATNVLQQSYDSFTIIYNGIEITFKRSQ